MIIFLRKKKIAKETNKYNNKLGKRILEVLSEIIIWNIMSLFCILFSQTDIIIETQRKMGFIIDHLYLFTLFHCDFFFSTLFLHHCNALS